MADEIHRIRVALVRRAVRPPHGLGLILRDALAIAVTVGQVQLCFDLAAAGAAAEGFQFRRVGGSGEAREGERRDAESDGCLHGLMELWREIMKRAQHRAEADNRLVATGRRVVFIR